MWIDINFDRLKDTLVNLKYDECLTTFIEKMFMDLNDYYAQDHVCFDDFYYEHNDKLMIHMLDNIGFYDGTIAASKTNNYENIFLHVMNNSHNADIVLTLFQILAEQSPKEFNKYQADLLNKLLAMDIYSSTSSLPSRLSVLATLFIHIYGIRECYDSEVKIVNNAIGHGILDEFIGDVLPSDKYPDLMRRLMCALPNEFKYDLYRLGINI